MLLDKIEENILIYCITLSLMICSMILSGFTVSFLWGVVMVGSFNFIALSTAQGVGLMLIVTFTRQTLFSPLKFKCETSEFGEIFKQYFSGSTAYLVFGYVLSFII